jgi:hypothetical protein
MKKLMKALLEAKLKDAPQAMKNLQMRNFERMDFKDEDEFFSFLGEIESDSEKEGSKEKKEFKGIKVVPDLSDDKIKSTLNGIMGW